MKKPLFSIGTRIIAVKHVGAVEEGSLGIVTGVAHLPYLLFWKRPFYLCTFLGNVKVAMQPSEIDDYDHGRTLEELELDYTKLEPAEQLLHIMGKSPFDN